MVAVGGNRDHSRWHCDPVDRGHNPAVRGRIEVSEFLDTDCANGYLGQCFFVIRQTRNTQLG